MRQLEDVLTARDPHGLACSRSWHDSAKLTMGKRSLASRDDQNVSRPEGARSASCAGVLVLAVNDWTAVRGADWSSNGVAPVAALQPCGFRSKPLFR